VSAVETYSGDFILLNLSVMRGANRLCTKLGNSASDEMWTFRIDQSHTRYDERSGVALGVRVETSTRVRDIPNQRENGEKFLGRNRRPEQTQMFEHLKLGLSHVITYQERAILYESLPRPRRPRSWVRFSPRVDGIKPNSKGKTIPSGRTLASLKSLCSSHRNQICSDSSWSLDDHIYVFSLAIKARELHEAQFLHLVASVSRL
jgi:hypothetical protein